MWKCHCGCRNVAKGVSDKTADISCQTLWQVAADQGRVEPCALSWTPFAAGCKTGEPQTASVRQVASSHPCPLQVVSEKQRGLCTGRTLFYCCRQVVDNWIIHFNWVLSLSTTIRSTSDWLVRGGNKSPTRPGRNVVTFFMTSSSTLLCQPFCLCLVPTR